MVSAAFVNATPLTSLRASSSKAAVSSRVAPSMVLSKNQAARLASIPSVLLTALPALATEGTGEGLGIDTPLLYIPMILVPTVFFIFFLQFGRSQINEDFTGPYDERRN